MKIGIMQPYFFPYIGYFSLINYVDEFVFFDTPQYISHGWINRNRVLQQDGLPHYIIVPIQKAPRETAINRIKISENERWIEKIFAQLSAYKKKAPFYKETVEFLHNVLESDTWTSIAELNIKTTKAVCDYIGISTVFSVFSDMAINIDAVCAPDEWALNITKAMRGEIYVNPPGGESFFDRRKYDASGIELLFLKSNLPPYIQRIGRFEPGLSIIDVMMFNDKEQIQWMLNDYTLE